MAISRAAARPEGVVGAWTWLTANLAIEVEQRRLFPWIAVCFGLGILLFFQADGRPALWAPAGASAACAGAALLARSRLGASAALIGLSALFAGFAAGTIRTASVDAPVLRRVIVAPVTGIVEAVDDRADGRRLLLRLAAVQGLPDGERPTLARVSLRKGPPLAAGQFVSATARLLPPPPPAWPGGYDFGRDAYYRGIGAVGSLTGAVRVLEAPAPLPFRLHVAAQVDVARNALTERIASAIGGKAGGVAAALVTGKRGLIPEETNDVLRAAGIFHIVSISGLHMVLAAGTVFWLIRSILALSPAAALFWPVKKIAATGAMAGAAAYCVFSGGEVATVRSLIMSLVMFGAVLVDRPALSVRNLSLAALVVLAREPEALLGPSFQMSFGAVAGMMALVPLFARKFLHGATRSDVGRALQAAGRAGAGLVVTTLVAGIATAPFAAYHFQSLTPYGLVGNALALPLVSLVVMPSALAGVLAYPFGLDGPVWQLMGWAVALVLDVSAWVGGLQGSTQVVPALGIGALLLLSAALLLASVPVSALRWLAVVPAGAGMAAAASPTRFDVYVDRDGAGAAIRSAGGHLTVVGKPSGFVVEQWLRADGDGRSSDDPGLRRDARCDGLGCVVQDNTGRSVALVLDPSGFQEDCRRAAVVLTRLRAPPDCRAPLVLDRNALALRGATAVRFGGEGIAVRSVKGGAESLPWTRTPAVIAVDGAAGGSEKAPTPGRPDRAGPPARPVPEQDLPEDWLSSDEPG